MKHTRRKLRICYYLLKKSLTENFLLYAVELGSQAAVKDLGETFEEWLSNTPRRQYLAKQMHVFKCKESHVASLVSIGNLDDLPGKFHLLRIFGYFVNVMVFFP